MAGPGAEHDPLDLLHADAGLRALPASPASRQEPTPLSCLRCQLLGRRKLLCAKEDACRETRHVSAFGPVLLAGWLATLVAFFVAVWR